MTITFIGHRQAPITKTLESKLIQTIEENILEENVSFYCGGYGNFDNACAKIVASLKSKYPTIQSFYITPYIGKNAQSRLEIIKQTGWFDDIIYPALENVPLKFAITKRNEYMINSADLVIAYIYRTMGGAYTSYLYAKRKKKKIICL